MKIYLTYFQFRNLLCHNFNKFSCQARACMHVKQICLLTANVAGKQTFQTFQFYTSNYMCYIILF